MERIRTQLLLILLFLTTISAQASPVCNINNKDARFDCFPGHNVTQAGCVARGCCWESVSVKKPVSDGVEITAPDCYFPSNYPSYNITTLKVCIYQIWNIYLEH